VRLQASTHRRKARQQTRVNTTIGKIHQVSLQGKQLHPQQWPSHPMHKADCACIQGQQRQIPSTGGVSPSSCQQHPAAVIALSIS
jgi:hypothetical protein